MTIRRLHGDENGETYLTPVELPIVENPGHGVTSVKALGEIPGTIFGIAELIEPMPDYGLHPAPCRQFLVLLQGNYEITTTTGDTCVFQRGDVLITDDVGTKGHYLRDCGDEPLMMFRVSVGDDWEFPSR